MTDERWTHPLIQRLRTHANQMEAQHLPHTADILREAAEEMEGGAKVFQAVLDAIKGTLDPSTQIADHPNVKFAQMQRLNWLEGKP